MTALHHHSGLYELAASKASGRKKPRNRKGRGAEGGGGGDSKANYGHMVQITTRLSTLQPQAPNKGQITTGDRKSGQISTGVNMCFLVYTLTYMHMHVYLCFLVCLYTFLVDPQG